MKLDHFAFSSPSLDKAIADFEQWSGVRAVHGGSHPNMGTRNALVALGPRLYLALDGPDPAQPLANNNGARMAAQTGYDLSIFAVATTDIGKARDIFADFGIDAEIRSGSRLTTSGQLLEWDYLVAGTTAFGYALPHVSQWKSDRHPSLDAPGGVTMESFTVSHPDPAGLRRFYDALGLSIPVVEAGKPALELLLEGAKGRFRLSSMITPSD